MLTCRRNKIITGSRDKTVRIWDIETLSCTLVIGPPNVVSDPSIMKDNDNLPVHYSAKQAGNSQDDSDLVRESESMPETTSFSMHHEQSILCLQYDEEILVTGSSDSTCIVYDVKNGYTPGSPHKRAAQGQRPVYPIKFDVVGSYKQRFP